MEVECRCCGCWCGARCVDVIQRCPWGPFFLDMMKVVRELGITRMVDCYNSINRFRCIQ